MVLLKKGFVPGIGGPCVCLCVCIFNLQPLARSSELDSSTARCLLDSRLGNCTHLNLVLTDILTESKKTLASLVHRRSHVAVRNETPGEMGPLHSDVAVFLGASYEDRSRLLSGRRHRLPKDRDPSTPPRDQLAHFRPMRLVQKKRISVLAAGV